MVIKIGIVGMSEGNGHPLSFSAIINGYDKQYFKEANWPVIYNYLKTRDEADFGILDAKVTHIWTQDIEISETIAKACKIESIVSDYKEMIAQVDAVIIARDDVETHYEIAKPFLESGKYVFIDKPLTDDLEELEYYLPYLKSGKLMSLSGMRYAAELDSLRNHELGKILSIHASVVNDLNKYGIHMVDALYGSLPYRAVSTMVLDDNTYYIKLDDNVKLYLECLGEVCKTFDISVFGISNQLHFSINDNFSMFKRTLWHFIRNIKSEDNYLEKVNLTTIDGVLLLIACNEAQSTKELINLTKYRYIYDIYEAI